MVPVAVHTALTTLTAFRKGRSDAREGRTIQPVPDATVDATLPHLSPTVRAMVEPQRLTGMRPGEVCMMRSCDVNTEGRIWEYRPSSHKTEHHERERVVFIGPKAQAVLKPFLSRDLQAFLFSPERSAQEHLDLRREARITPDGQGNGVGTNRVRRPKRSPGERFDADSDRQAIEYACDRAWPVPDDAALEAAVIAERAKANKGEGELAKLAVVTPDAIRKAGAEWRREHRWAPNRLRHLFATNARREYGIEAVKILLGHSDLSTSELYAERDAAKAAAVIARIG
jgi:integrase